MDGKVKKVNSSGYGFIETAKDIDFFFHHSSYQGDWKLLLKRYVSDEIILVEFDNDPEAPSGPRAINVRIVGDSHG